MNDRIGIYFVSKHGQTRKIANYLGEWFRGLGSEVQIIELKNAPRKMPDILDFDAVLIGAAIYQDRYAPEIRAFAREHREELNRVATTGFFSVGFGTPPGAAESDAKLLGPVREFLDELAWSPKWIASFPGALNYREYDPLTRWVMKRICEKEGGPIDTTRDHYLTRWNEVSEFAAAIFNEEPQSRYRGEKVTRATRTLNALVPDFEHRVVQRLTIEGTPDEVRSAIETMEMEDMPLAEILASIRNFGQKALKHSPHLSFRGCAEDFGAVMVPTGQRHEIAGVLVGQFWKRDYGIRRIRNVDEVKELSGEYAEALTNFWFDDIHDGKTVVRTETRIHSIAWEAEQKFGLYWFVVSLGVRLYMWSALRGIRRSLGQRRWERHAVAA